MRSTGRADSWLLLVERRHGVPVTLIVRAHEPMPRRHIRKRSSAARVAGEASALANRLSWKGAALLGVVLFVVFYWLLPAWLRSNLNPAPTSALRPVVEYVVGRRIYWSQILGIALALVCAFYAVHNYFSSRRLGHQGQRGVGMLSRILARILG